MAFGFTLGLSLGMTQPVGGGSPDTTAPVINSISYDSTTKALTLDIDEASGSVTVVWATSLTSNSPTYEVGVGWTGDANYETGSYSATSGSNTDPISVTGTTPDGSRKLRVYLYDAAGNLSAPASVTITVDNTAPTISAYSPVDGATDAPITSNLVVTFSEAIDAAEGAVVTLRDVTGTPSVVEAWNSAVAGTWSAGDTVWTVTPSSPMTDGNDYAVQYSGFEDAYANQVAAVTDDITWSFTAVDPVIPSKAKFDLSDTTSVWTDSVGGTQATVGDTVAAISDLSGNGNHGTFPSGKRPVYRQEGTGEYYLDFAGSEYGSVALNLSGGAEVSIVSGFERAGTGSTESVYEFTPDLNANPGAFGCYMSTKVTAQAKNHTSLGYSGYNTSVDGTTALVLSHVIDFYGSTRPTESLRVRVNGVSDKASTAGTYTDHDVNLPNSTLYIGMRGGSSLPFSGKLYFLGIYDSALSLSDLQSVETEASANVPGVSL